LEKSMLHRIEREAALEAMGILVEKHSDFMIGIHTPKKVRASYSRFIMTD
jgi:hypothetical protein